MENRRPAKNKYLPLFGGIYLDIRNNILIVNVKDLSIANDSDFDPFRHILSFRLVNNSLNELNTQLQSSIDLKLQQGWVNFCVYIDIEVNDVVLIPNIEHYDSWCSIFVIKTTSFTSISI
ncbi:hypothetical protein F8M41_021920 [Gigaspora margarita]|uniref:Uncharacterized protein n=1 Tax=Gigaspora margarita TaxID=4874 RepID=A0A8H4B1B4_GIGMA|nr:hypothetical protein F8M41_021920 [Gigaspora margarita]